MKRIYFSLLLLGLALPTFGAVSGGGSTGGGTGGLTNGYTFQSPLALSGTNVSLAAAIAQLNTNKAATNVSLVYTSASFPALVKNSGTITLLVPGQLTNWAALNPLTWADMITNRYAGTFTNRGPIVIGDLMQSTNGDALVSYAVGAGGLLLGNATQPMAVYAPTSSILGHFGVASNVTAAAFYGDGSHLTGITGGGGSSGPGTNAYTLNYVGTNLIVNFAAFYPTQTVRVTLTNNALLWVTNVLDYDVTLEFLQNGTGGYTVTTNSTWDNFRFGDEVTGLYNNTNANRITLIKLRGRGTNAIVTGILSNIRP